MSCALRPGAATRPFWNARGARNSSSSRRVLARASPLGPGSGPRGDGAGIATRGRRPSVRRTARRRPSTVPKSSEGHRRAPQRSYEHTPNYCRSSFGASASLSSAAFLSPGLVDGPLVVLRLRALSEHPARGVAGRGRGGVAGVVVDG